MPRQDVSTRQDIVTAFLRQFTLTHEEVEAIVSREYPVNKQFFAAMDKAERIRDDCRVLMAGEDGPTRAGYTPPTTMPFPSLNPSRQHGYSDDHIRIP